MPESSSLLLVTFTIMITSKEARAKRDAANAKLSAKSPEERKAIVETFYEVLSALSAEAILEYVAPFLRDGMVAWNAETMKVDVGFDKDGSSLSVNMKLRKPAKSKSVKGEA